MGRPKKNVTNLTEVKLSGGMKISRDDRLILLKAFNNLQDILMSIDDVHDITLSEVRNLNNLRFEMLDILKFEPISRDCHYYCEYKLGESKWVNLTTLTNILNISTD